MPGSSLLFAMTLDFFLLLGAALLVFARSIPLSFDGFRVRRADVVQARRDSTCAVSGCATTGTEHKESRSWY